MKPYNGRAWFWLADDGRVYGSAENTIGTADDAAYKDFIAEGSSATIWPRDDTGQQTLASLQDVVGAFGITVPGATPVDPVSLGSATKLGLKRALAETGDKAVFSSPQWEAVKALLAKDEDLQEDWNLAIEVKASDPVVQGAVKALKWKVAQVNALIVRANELVA